ncbi:MAG: YceI family protein [Anaerolineae bacterium]|nr:YceI family protein [Anaerolineae bacterium]
MPRYNLDPTHSAADFSARHMMITTVRGSFRNVTGYLDFDPANPAAAYVEATIETNQITSTGLQQRDDHLKSADFLDIENYPVITFKSTKVEPYNGGSNAKITGDLTIRDVTKAVTVDAEFLGESKSPFGTTNIGFTGTTKINREDFGLNWNMALEAGGWLVGKDITITLDVEAILVTENVPA